MTKMEAKQSGMIMCFAAHCCLIVCLPGGIGLMVWSQSGNEGECITHAGSGSKVEFSRVQQTDTCYVSNVTFVDSDGGSHLPCSNLFDGFECAEALEDLLSGGKRKCRRGQVDTYGLVCTGESQSALRYTMGLILVILGSCVWCCLSCCGGLLMVRPEPVAVAPPSGLIVSGCNHETLAQLVHGEFALLGENHGKPTYKKDRGNGLDVMIYYWDERDGPTFAGWWFGPKVGDNHVWAYHPGREALPPADSWKVPSENNQLSSSWVVDDSLIIQPFAVGSLSSLLQ